MKKTCMALAALIAISTTMSIANAGSGLKLATDKHNLVLEGRRMLSVWEKPADETTGRPDRVYYGYQAPGRTINGSSVSRIEFSSDSGDEAVLDAFAPAACGSVEDCKGQSIGVFRYKDGSVWQQSYPVYKR